ncbi:MAG: tetratricopeptide repeat protein [Bacteroidetes bacterium]|nr:tetratricopeptide repeat protein [Bacteroidota bacterium]
MQYSFFAQDNKLDSLLTQARSAPSDTEKVRIENKICKIYIVEGNHEEALKLINGNLVLLKKNINKSVEATVKDLNNYRNSYGDCLILEGLAHTDLSHYQKATESILRAVKEFTATGNKAGVAKAYNNLGNVNFKTGKFTDAVKYHFASLKINESIGNKKGVASSLNNMANIYASRGNNKEALAKYFEALNVYLAEDIKVGIGNAYNNIALVYSQLNNYDSAAFYTQKAFNIRTMINDKRGIASCLSNLGVFSLEQRKFDEAVTYFKKALEAKEDLNDLSGVGAECKNLATVYVYLEKPKIALEYVQRALEIAKQTGSLDETKSAYSVGAMALEKIGDFKKAYAYQKLYITLNDSDLVEKNARIITEMNTKYETEKKEKENQLLQIQNDLSTETIKQQKIITYLVVGGLMLTLFLAYFIFKGLKKQKQANSIISNQKKEVEKQKDLVDEKQKEILDSIHYAKRIQNTLLAHKDFLDENLTNNFVLFKPKDIVSGDFYWATKAQANAEELFYLAVCDSTGHGVPGAFMSLLNIGFLSEAIKEKDIFEPHQVFNYVRMRLVESISKEEQKDGFDGILLCINKTTGKITYAAANNNPVIVSNNTVINLKADKMPVGKGERQNSFTLFDLELLPNDTLYLFTDGYPDQFGGPKGKKFKYKQLEDLLVSNNALPLNQQTLLLENVFDNWKGNLEQIDDVLVVGLKLH